MRYYHVKLTFHKRAQFCIAQADSSIEVFERAFDRFEVKGLVGVDTTEIPMEKYLRLARLFKTI